MTVKEMRETIKKAQNLQDLQGVYKALEKTLKEGNENQKKAATTLADILSKKAVEIKEKIEAEQAAKFAIGNTLTLKEADGFTFTAQIVNITSKQIVLLDTTQGSRDYDTHIVCKWPIDKNTLKFYEGKWEAKIL